LRHAAETPGITGVDDPARLHAMGEACAQALRSAAHAVTQLRRELSASHRRHSSAARRFNDAALSVWAVLCGDHVGSLVTSYLSVRDQARMQGTCHRFSEIGTRALRELRVCVLHVSATAVHASATEFVVKRCPALRELHVRRFTPSTNAASSEQR
jgi:hypothetical protein